jgi:hypothetical protein
LGRPWTSADGPRLFSGLAPDMQQVVLTVLEPIQLGLDRLGGVRPDRKPRWHEVDRIDLKQVRPLVRVGQVSVQLQVGPRGASPAEPVPGLEARQLQPHLGKMGGTPSAMPGPGDPPHGRMV